MDRLESIDAKIQKGWVLTQEKYETIKGCDIWLEAWDEIKDLFADGFAENVEDLDKKYKWSQWINNYVQYLEMELQNAGVDDPAYHVKRIDYCRELLQWCGTDELLIANTRCAMAEAHFDSGDEAGCDRLFEGWLQDDPDWGLGYRAWSECYLQKEGITGYEKAEDILLAGHARSGLRVEDKYEMTAHLMAIYDDTGRPDKFKEFEKIFRELHSQMPGYDKVDRELDKMLRQSLSAKPKEVVYDKPEPVRVVKIGRNEPCPCGSGKKYKKCCGA